MDELRAEKERTRRRMRARLRDLGPQHRRQSSQAIQARLHALVSGPDVMLYAWFRTEVQLDDLIEQLMAAWGSCLLPRIAGDHLEVRRVTDLRRDLISGRWGLREPGPHCPLVNPNTLRHLIVPGLAFDISCNRLGRGGGYYDRLLSQLHPNTPRIAVAFEAQIIEKVPTEAHDLRVSLIVTESRDIQQP